MEPLQDRPAVHIEAVGIEKHYGGVRALRGVDVSIRRGEVHALIGENGAGKSTLGKIISGQVRASAGRIRVDGREVSYREPHEALADGIAMIDQELALLPDSSVLDNVFLGSERSRGGVLDLAAQRARFTELLAETGFDLDPRALVSELRLADQQKVEVLRALARDAELIVMDEPSASLNPIEVAQLHAIIRGLKARGATVVIVSHFLEEVLAITDAVTVLRDGSLVQTSRTADETKEALIYAMLGRHLAEEEARSFGGEIGGAPVFEAVDLVNDALRGVSLAVRPGEILGIGGLVGSGRTELCRAMFGADRLVSGELRLDGERVRYSDPFGAIRAGVAMLPENRKELGLLMGRSITENITLPHVGRFSRFGILSPRRERRRAQELAARVGVKTPNVDDLVSTLSGGNQQKVVLSKWLVENPRVLIVDEPTRGVDVGAKASIYELLRELAAQGIAIIVVSSEIEELLALAHSIVVMSRGHLVARFDRSRATKDALLAAAFTVPGADGPGGAEVPAPMADPEPREAPPAAASHPDHPVKETIA
ncbi:sugar ABC transporter ATP-binding protein [Leucobacter celer]|uniref:sugar ABC transporter ATP-binding protein n=1 Tax=Leucobacter celer TaxID=668625 RepID=UPI0019D344DF|nr:sugar ABC transporter ATP-binding protein [Leucobacter celer]